MQTRHKDGARDPRGEAKQEEFKNLHEDQIQKHGVDNISLKEAFVEVLKEKPNHYRGLGLSPMPLIKGKNGGESNQIRVELIAQLQQLQQKEVALRLHYRMSLVMLKAANLELKTNMEHM